jgi:hypothetical protein
MKLKIICAWCTKKMQVKEHDGEFSESAVSHGIEELLNEKP